MRTSVRRKKSWIMDYGHSRLGSNPSRDGDRNIFVHDNGDDYYRDNFEPCVWLFLFLHVLINFWTLYFFVYIYIYMYIYQHPGILIYISMYIMICLRISIGEVSTEHASIMYMKYWGVCDYHRVIKI
jgi:hypothetical protein